MTGLIAICSSDAPLLAERDARARSRRDGREGHFLTRDGRQAAQGAVGQGSTGRRGEIAGGRIVQEALDRPVQDDHRHQIALRHRAAQDRRGEGGAGELLHQIDTRGDAAAIGTGQGHLLPGDRGEIIVEGQQELLDIAPRGIRRALREADIAPWVEDRGVQEVEQRVDRTVIGEAEAADLRAGRAAVEFVEQIHTGETEHADLCCTCCADAGS